MIERLAAAFEIDREEDSAIEIPAPEPRPGLDLELRPSEIAVRVNRPSAERARELTAVRREPRPAVEHGEGPAPLVGRRSAEAPTRPLSYTAIAAHGGGESPRSTATLRCGKASARGRPEERRRRPGAGRFTPCSSGARPMDGASPRRT